MFYLFDAGQCDAVMRGTKPSVPAAASDLLPADQLLVNELTPLAVFSSKSRRTPREEDDPDTVASPASRIHHASKSPLDERQLFLGAYSNTPVATASSGVFGHTSPSVLGGSHVPPMSKPSIVTNLVVIVTILRYILTANVVS